MASLHARHVARLTAFVSRLRKKNRKRVPYFDPLDGGIGAEVLFLFETPGRQARNSGFVSRNNPDETAKNFLKFNQDARLLRERTISWNIVPWYIGYKRKIRAASASDCKKGIQSLFDLLELLPKLRAVVFFGKTAQRGAIPVANLRLYELFEAPHPSPQSVNPSRGNRRKIIRVLGDVKAYLDAVKSERGGG
jgi:uracil-DNA glycosylase